MPIISFGNHVPEVHHSAFLAPDAWLTGQISVGAESSFFFCAVARGDVNPIQIGQRTNVQDHAMLHTSHGLGPCQVGDDVTVGHRAILHGCKIGNRCIIGMGAIILDGAEIGDDCIIGAHSLVTMNTRIAAGSMAFGSPAKVIRPLTQKEKDEILFSARSYQEVSQAYKSHFSVA